MSYKEFYKADSNYQKIINKFKAEKNELQRKANYGTYKVDALMSEGATIQSNLTDAIKEHNQTKVKEINESMKMLKNGHKDVGYTARPNEAKEFEMRYALSEDHELTEMVDNINSNDLLEINLLRMELKKRELTDADRQVKNYVTTNKIGGLTDDEQRQYDIRQKELSVYNTMGNSGLVIDEEYKSLDNIQKELHEVSRSTDAVW